MGVLTKSEATTEEMIDIMHHIQNYVPQSSDGQLLPLYFGGDQLTRERAYHAQDAKLQSTDPKGRLIGVIPKVEDWHTRVVFYQVGILLRKGGGSWARGGNYLPYCQPEITINVFNSGNVQSSLQQRFHW